MSQDFEYTVAPAFNDAKNITVGKARVIWVKASHHHPEGWILPGGRRTDNFMEAHSHAARIDELMEKKP